MAFIADAGALHEQGFTYPPLAKRISAACGPLHQVLNEDIMTGLPLALPPNAKDTRLYAAGLASFGMIYLTFEELWQEIVKGSEAQSAHTQSVLKFLASLRPAGIERSSRIRSDLHYLHRTGEGDFLARLLSEGLAESTFRRHIQTSTIARPHILYAYAWCMYMAIFAGGRYVREDLANAGDHFWRHHGWARNPRAEKHEPAALDRLGYSFLSFDATDDGLYIQQTFLSNLLLAEDLFTLEEKDEVVKESKTIFTLTIGLVREMAERIKPHAISNMLESAPPPYSPPPYDPRAIAERSSIESTSLLRLEADEEEVMAWREAPLRRSFWYRLRLVLLCFLSGLTCSTLIFAAKWFAPKIFNPSNPNIRYGWS